MYTARDHVEHCRALAPIAIGTGSLVLLVSLAAVAGWELHPRAVTWATFAAGAALVCLGGRDGVARVDSEEE